MGQKHEWGSTLQGIIEILQMGESEWRVYAECRHGMVKQGGLTLLEGKILIVGVESQVSI